ncbi:branched-chain amino acid transport system II carrier protein [Terrisporobacter sp.]|uniref:branched-chain amino acid transport system II carrier protein n=1 Tax=Terrisporobacter sp. TaxID=1965305 RepID=UPI002A832A46|nr:branched-chain amino acid transport system II carrier protein [Terrisporobacter sp.]MDY4736670.1 branched-chain amino acid transport system II carrier protein [Terrisporobacter sp.]
MKKQQTDIAVVGFALFSMFFGAGNLLFPPYLGLISGGSWLISLGGFILADVGLSLLVITAAAKCEGELDTVLCRAGNIMAKLIGIASVLCIGPLLAIPRTAATTYEMGISPIIGSTGTLAPVIVSIVFFGLTLFLTIRPSKVVDIIGKILTPALLIALAVLIIIGIISPIGGVSEKALIENSLFAEGISQGYLTMDALGAAALATVAISSISERGYNNPKDKVKLTLKAGLVAGLALTLVYGGLTYLGSTLSTAYGVDTPQASLMVVITNSLLGYPGKLVLCIIVSLACLTTAIGLTSASAKYFASISNNKIKYETVVIVVCLFSAVVSNFGVSTIIKFSAPVLEIVYPVLIALVVMTIFGEKIKNDNAFKGAGYVTLFVSLLSVLSNLLSINQIRDLLNLLPFASIGFNWILPAIVGAIIGGFIKNKSEDEKQLSKYA